MQFDDVVADNAKAFTQKLLAGIKNDQSVQQFNTQRIIKTGKIIDVSASASVVYSSQFGRELIAFTERDITEQHKVIKNECAQCLKNLADIVMDNQEALILLDVKGKITAWNAGAVALYGWNYEEAINMSFANLLPESDRAKANEMFDRLMQDDNSQQQLGGVKRVTKDKREIEVNMTASILGNSSGDALSIITSETKK